MGCKQTEAPFIRFAYINFKRFCFIQDFYDKRDDFDFIVLSFRFWIATFLLSRLMVFKFLNIFGLQECIVSWLIAMLVTKRSLSNFSNRGIGILGKLFSKFYRRHYELISKNDTGIKTLLLQNLWESEFYGDLVYKLKKIIGKPNFSE